MNPSSWFGRIWKNCTPICWVWTGQMQPVPFSTLPLLNTRGRHVGLDSQGLPLWCHSAGIMGKSLPALPLSWSLRVFLSPQRLKEVRAELQLEDTYPFLSPFDILSHFKSPVSPRKCLRMRIPSSWKSREQLNGLGKYCIQLALLAKFYLWPMDRWYLSVNLGRKRLSRSTSLDSRYPAATRRGIRSCPSSEPDPQW